MFLSYNWGINLDSIPAPGYVECGEDECYVGFFPRTGLGLNGNLCDSGGWCAPSPAGGIFDAGIQVKNHIPWEEAYRAFVKQHGTSGAVYRSRAGIADIDYDYYAWGVLCVGFASLPVIAIAVSNLAPNTTCGLVPKPEIQCSFMLGSEINLGTVAVRQTIPDGRVSGSFSCVGGGATISASLITAQPVLGGQNVSLKMNGVPISRVPQVVGQGRDGQLLLEAHVNGTIDEPGVHQDSVVIMINFV
ncbi:hypothetical protein NJH77_05380 [Serratia fonticola]|uniref:hypothetical protein n=1 Tax=Serratia fonticola TaxID=47917 RepID=UPI0020979C43|nr:hypothetical protein [Serratia fonticola]MCO7508686.1 hypothetical protein [Serratia fonticola]